MKKQTSNVQPAFGHRGDLRRGRRLILNIQHLLDCHPERSEGPRERALITPDTRKRVLHRIEIAFNRRLLTAAGGIHARKSQEVVAHDLPLSPTHGQGVYVGSSGLSSTGQAIATSLLAYAGVGGVVVQVVARPVVHDDELSAIVMHVVTGAEDRDRCGDVVMDAVVVG
jgi:hypothetical protein